MDDHHRAGGSVVQRVQVDRADHVVGIHQREDASHRLP
jgi:hypothetical protein